MTAWRQFLADFHGERPGVTEEVLRRGAADPYGWLADAVPAGPRRVLDLACGSAPLYDLLHHAPLAGRLGATWLGVDVARGELALASARGAGPLLRADATALPLPDASVDAVVCGMGLQVLQPLDRALAEAYRVLRPGGLLAALVPSDGPLTGHDRLRYARLLTALRQRRLHYPNADGMLVPALRTAGFRVLRDERRRLAYPLATDADGARLVRSLYLPGVDPGRVAAAAGIAARWRGGVGIPLRLLVAGRPTYAVTPNG